MRNLFFAPALSENAPQERRTQGDEGHAYRYGPSPPHVAQTGVVPDHHRRVVHGEMTAAMTAE
jgi:hypothetical protein